MMVPEGEDFAARVPIGQFHGTPLVVEVWRMGQDKVVVKAEGTTTQNECSAEDIEITIFVTITDSIDRINSLLKIGYRKVSEEKGLTRSKTETKLPFPLHLLPNLLPESSKYGVKLVIGMAGE